MIDRLNHRGHVFDEAICFYFEFGIGDIVDSCAVPFIKIKIQNPAMQESKLLIDP